MELRRVSIRGVNPISRALGAMALRGREFSGSLRIALLAGLLAWVPFSLSFADTIVVGTQELSGTILDKSTDQTIYLRTNSGDELSFPRNMVEIASWHGVTNAGELIRLATEKVEEAAAAAKADDFQRAAELYATALVDYRTVKEAAGPRYREAERLIESTLESFAGLADQLFTDAEAEIERGKAQTQAGNYEAAITSFESARMEMDSLAGELPEDAREFTDELQVGLKAELDRAEAEMREEAVAAGWVQDPETGSIARPSAEYLLSLLAKAREREDYEGAERTYALIQENFPEAVSRETDETMASLYFDWAQALIAERKVGAALKRLKLIKTKYPTTAIASEAERQHSRIALLWALIRYGGGGLALLVMVTAGRHIVRSRHGAIVKRSRKQVRRLEYSWFEDLDGSSGAYTSIIADLTALSKRVELSDAGKDALGRAYLGKARICRLKNQKESAVELFKKGAALAPVSWRSHQASLAEYYLYHEDRSDTALKHYIAYLNAPADEVNEGTAAEILDVLESICAITPEMDRAAQDKKMRLNAAVATVPGPGVRLVVIRGGLTGMQFPISDQIRVGRGKENEVFIPDASLPRYGFSITREASADAESGWSYWLRDIHTGAVIALNETALRSDHRLKDGDQIKCGEMLLAFYERPRPCGDVLSWPHYNLGVGYYARGQYSQAEHAFEQAVNLGDTRADVYWYLGRAHHAMGRPHRALEDFDAALAKDRTYHRAHYSAARVHLKLVIEEKPENLSDEDRNHIQSAISHLEKAVKLAKDVDTYYITLAEAYAQLGNFKKAKSAAKSALSVNDKNPETHVLFSRFARADGDVAGAKSAAQRALTLSRDHVEANYIFGDLAFEEGDYSNAAIHLRRARQLESRAERFYFTATPSFVYRLGRSLFEIEAYADALRALSQPGKREPQARLYRARCQAALHDLGEAIDELSALVEECPDQHEARYYLASTLAAHGSFDRALEAIVPLVPVADWEGRARVLQAKIHMRMERFTEAEASLKAADEATQRSCWFERGCLSYAQGRLDEAKKAFQHALRDDPEHVPAYLWLGRTCYRQHDHGGASQHFEQVIRICGLADVGRETRTYFAAAHYYLGLLQQSSDPKQAAQHFQQARAYGYVSSAIAYQTAIAYAESGQYTEAITELSAIAMEGDDPIVLHNLAAVSCRIGIERFEAGHYGEAIRPFEQARHQYVRLEAVGELEEVKELLAEAHFRLAAERLRVGDGDGAVSNLERAHELKPGEGLWHYCLGVAYFTQQRYDDAERVFRELKERHGGQRRVIQALALTREKQEAVADAEALWNELIQSADSEARLTGLTGMASLRARQGKWKEAGDLLKALIKDSADTYPETVSHLCRMAISYYSIAGDHASAEAIVRDHLTQSQAEEADGFLGAILAQQKRYSEAEAPLSRAVKRRDDPAVQKLYEAVVRVLAAEQILADDLKGASGRLKNFFKVVPEQKAGAEIRSLRDSLEAALALSDINSSSIDEKVWRAYKKAYESNKSNPRILRNFAIASDHMALQLEGGGNGRGADTYWNQSRSLWKSMMQSENGLWQAYVDAYNEGRGKRERVKKGEIKDVPFMVMRRLAEMHGAYASVYAQSRSMDNARRHVGYARQMGDHQEVLEPVAESLVEEYGRQVQASRSEEAFPLIELAYEICSSSNSICNAYAQALINRAVGFALEDRLDEAEKHLEKVDGMGAEYKGLTNKAWAIVYVMRAIAHVEKGRVRQAIDAYSKAKSRMPGLEQDPEVRILAARYFLSKSLHCIKNHDLAQAKRDMEQAIRLYPRILVEVQGLLQICIQLGIRLDAESLAAGAA